MSDRRVLIIGRILVTLALLAFAFFSGADPATANVIVGAVAGYWLREGEGTARRTLTRRKRRAPTNDTAGDE